MRYFLVGKKLLNLNQAYKNAQRMSSLSLYTKLESLPKALKAEVLDFIEFLLAKSKRKSTKPVATFGSAKGKIKMAVDFDAPLDDFKDYM